MFNMAPDKFPQPDGFPLLFFQKYWSLVGNSVTKVVEDFFHSRRMLNEVNHDNTLLILFRKLIIPDQLITLDLAYAQQSTKLSLKF